MNVGEMRTVSMCALEAGVAGVVHMTSRSKEVEVEVAARGCSEAGTGLARRGRQAGAARVKVKGRLGARRTGRGCRGRGAQEGVWPLVENEGRGDVER